MTNPYTPTIEPSTVQETKRHIASDLGRLAVLVVVFFTVAYVVSLPFSKMLSKDCQLIALSPFIPVGLLAEAIAGETIWTLLMTVLAGPVSISMVVGVLGVRKKRAIVAVISMGVLYGLFLRLFFLLYDIA